MKTLNLYAVTYQPKGSQDFTINVAATSSKAAKKQTQEYFGTRTAVKAAKRVGNVNVPAGL
jgi:hypothetical protein